MTDDRRIHTVVLVNIRSAHNVGAIFRTADGAGVKRIVLVGYTPWPVDRFGRTNKEIAKTALGAEKVITWTTASDLCKAAQMLREEGCAVIGLEQDACARDYRTYRVNQLSALVLGNEVTGLSLIERAHCDALIEIPMRGTKESLNVSVACGIALFRLNDGC